PPPCPPPDRCEAGWHGPAPPPETLRRGRAPKGRPSASAPPPDSQPGGPERDDQRAAGEGAGKRVRRAALARDLDLDLGRVPELRRAVRERLQACQMDGAARGPD